MPSFSRDDMRALSVRRLIGVTTRAGLRREVKREVARYREELLSDPEAMAAFLIDRVGFRAAVERCPNRSGSEWLRLHPP